MTEFPYQCDEWTFNFNLGRVNGTEHICRPDYLSILLMRATNPKIPDVPRRFARAFLGRPTRLTFINHTPGSLITGQMLASQVRRAQR